MRNKLFFAFLAVVMTALVSNLLYEYFVTRDFEDYVSGTKEDKLYWVLASVEGSYEGGIWDSRSLHDAIHWAIMLGFDVKVRDFSGKELINSGMIADMLSPAMKRRMKNLGDIDATESHFESYPLYSEGREIGALLARQIEKPVATSRKEILFKKRGKSFLVLSFAIAGGGAIMLSVFFTLFLSRPLKKMKDVVEAMAERDFSVRMPVTSHDEIGGLAESFNFMAEALEREEALRKHLTSNIAHELRTPLSIMKANVEALLDGVIDDHDRGVQNIRTEIEKLILLVQGIEDITMAEASFFIKKDYVMIDLRDFLETFCKKIALLAQAKNLELNLAGMTGLSVRTDVDKLERVLQNILSNAIRNTSVGSVSIDYGDKGNMFFISVKDTGTGIEKDRLDLIFGRFYHGPGSEGFGLGLAIVKEQLAVMGGSIEVESTPGEGATFTLRLPKNV